ncbi:serine/threonine-protein kinase [Streptomyces jeddahensis]|uniref:Serine/threonine-protein kinase AfsK n=1 Tax=Streptomyces jeddahensis TaxID=1716141 RepID=A0A177HHK3_9ACTN|nr:serine/threonine-protein kinase [Streptomyces jeddahensis]OAH10395.1 serine/threonine-protein kinase AfsK [Streptomyces jeddahensis]
MAPQQNAGAGAEAELPEYAGHYRLESCLGSGGMGVVHLARSTSGMKLAVKVVHAEFARDPEFRGRFRQEVAAARRVSGAFTAPVVDADPEAERPWMATLFIPGPTLSDHVKRNGPMPPAQLRRLMAGLAEALRDIHRVGVVHRDLKPSNVLLAEDGPKVIDFGISRPKDSELRTETGKLIGTPPFMAPEQFRRPREVGPAADVFALGSVMVHAATGRGPFDSDSPYVVAYQVVHDEPDLTGVAEELAPLVLRCLSKEPEDRPTPDELMRELRSVAASYDTRAFIPAQRAADEAPRSEPRATEAGAAEGTEGSEEPERRPGKRLGRRASLGAAALGLAVISALAAVHLLDGGGTTPERPTPRTTSAGFSGWEATPASKKSAPQCSYGAGRLLCAQPGLLFALDPGDGHLLWQQTVARTHRSRPPVVSGGLVQPSLDSGRRLEALDPASGRARWQRNMPAYSGLECAGGMLLLTSTDGTVVGVDSASGDTRWSHRIPGHSVPYFTSFAGDPLAYAVSTSDDGAGTRVTVVDPETGDVRWNAQLEGRLKPLGTAGGSVYLVSVDAVYGDAKAVVRYTPDTGAEQRVPLPVPLKQAHGTVRGNLVYLTGDGGSLAAVDMNARKQLWRFETSVIRGSGPVTDGRHVYVSAPDGRLLAIGTRDGKLLGQTPPRLGPNSDQIMGALPEPVIAGNYVYATAPDGTVFAVDGRNPAAW